MTAPTVVFSHGQESGPWGTKINAMAELVKREGARPESVDYRGMPTPGERVKTLVDACATYRERDDAPLVLVGSSMGGYVATAAAGDVGAAGVFLLAPAFYIEGFGAETPRAPNAPLTIVHGWHDDVVPVDNSIRFAREYSSTLHIVDGDHRLTANLAEINALLEQFLRQLGQDNRG